MRSGETATNRLIAMLEFAEQFTTNIFESLNRLASCLARAFLVVSLVLLAVSIRAQTASQNNSGDSLTRAIPPATPKYKDSQMLIAMKSGDTHPVAFESSVENKISRWFEFETLSFSIRYHFIETANGRAISNNNQYQVTAKGRFKFDPKGRFSIHAGLFTGRSFTGGWNASGWGTGRPQSNLYLKQLYFDACPINGVEFQYGGLAINNGGNTEATGYDADGYITGERIAVKRPKTLYFDDVTITYAYIGDLTVPNIFRRFRHLGPSNYHQFLVRKHFNELIDVSVDYTVESGIDTLRQAIKIKIPGSKLVDNILFENYERIDRGGGYGFNIYGEKKLSKTATLGGGFARIDRQMLNSDRFPQGQRFHLTALYALSHEFSISAAFTQAVGPTTGSLPRTRLDVALNYNFLQTLRRKKIL